MKTMAVICEYNPFHNGHAYQISQHRAMYGVDCVIAVMSGNFVQRGAPAICDKWVRAEMALCGGCDLVLELPTVYAVQSAERFSFGAIRLINQLYGINYLSFGSECGDILTLQRIAEAICQPDFTVLVSQEMKSGISYPTARLKVLCKILGENYRTILSQPNNILGIEYLKSLCELHSEITPITLKRTIAHHHPTAKNKFCSASYLRTQIKQNSDFSALLPPEVYWVYKRAEHHGKAPVSDTALNVIIPYLLRTKTREELLRLPDMTEGLEERFIEGGRKKNDANSIAEYIKTKRYTRTRIDRTLIHLLLGITKEDISLPPSYFRVLGMNENGAAYLKILKKNSDIPIITKTAKYSDFDKRMFRLDCTATDIYAMLYPNRDRNRAGLDYITSPIIKKKSCDKIHRPCKT